MHFYLHSLGQQHENKLSYFRLRADSTELLSPFYANQTTALEAIKQLLFRLRQNRAGDFVVRGKDDRYYLRIFDKKEPAVGRVPVFDKESAARSMLELWREGSRATTFPVQFMALDEEIAALSSLKELDLTETDQNYQWRETDATLIQLAENTLAGLRPLPGLQANLLRKPCESIFTAFEPSMSTDFPLFLGRKDEVKEVYTLLQKNNLLLLYGEARVGKTSLLQCGLANRIEKDGDRIIVVRRSDRPILATFSDHVRHALGPGEAEARDDAPPLALALQLAEESSQKIYLIFDQLEQLFISDKAEEERSVFIELVRNLTEIKDGRFRIVLSLRESMLAPLAEYEKVLPVLLDNRYRLLPIKEEVMRKASVNLLELLQANNLLAVDNSEGVSQKICQRLANDKGEVPVHCLQIYLHQLHQKSCQETEPGNPVPFTEELVDKMGPPALMIDEYISHHILDLRERQQEAKDPTEQAVLHREMQELENSRLQCGCEENRQQAVAAVAVAPVPAVLPWWLAPLAAIPLLLFGYWWISDNSSVPTACALVEAEDSCFAYANYLCTYGDSTDCSEQFRQILQEKNCDVWWDFQKLERYDDCTAYEAFYARYQDQGVCMDRVRARLIEMGCPLVRDTLTLTVTVRDTVIMRQPATYGGVAPLGAGLQGPNAEGPPCGQFGASTFKRIGPLWVMTDALPGGPYRWEDGLDACSASGFRLPCIGEIDYLLEKIYRDDPKRAFDMLTGTSECYLVNPNDAPSGRIEFWTATEANDGSAWTYTFDMSTKTIERQSATPKSARLPCLCVRKDPDQKGSSLPPCYQKSIRRPG